MLNIPAKIPNCFFVAIKKKRSKNWVKIDANYKIDGEKVAKTAEKKNLLEEECWKRMWKKRNKNVAIVVVVRKTRKII